MYKREWNHPTLSRVRKQLFMLYCLINILLFIHIFFPNHLYFLQLIIFVFSSVLISLESKNHYRRLTSSQARYNSPSHRPSCSSSCTTSCSSSCSSNSCSSYLSCSSSCCLLEYTAFQMSLKSSHLVSIFYVQTSLKSCRFVEPIQNQTNWKSSCSSAFNKYVWLRTF